MTSYKLDDPLSKWVRIPGTEVTKEEGAMLNTMTPELWDEIDRQLSDPRTTRIKKPLSHVYVGGNADASRNIFSDIHGRIWRDDPTECVVIYDPNS